MLTLKCWGNRSKEERQRAELILGFIGAVDRDFGFRRVQGGAEEVAGKGDHRLESRIEEPETLADTDLRGPDRPDGPRLRLIDSQRQAGSASTGACTSVALKK